MNGIKQRVAKLETAVSSRKTVYLWADDETLADQAIAARFPEGVPDGVKVVVYSWARADP